MDTGACAICGTTEALRRDHDHATGMVRGWLCNRCNVMLGYAQDSPANLRAGAVYLEEHHRTRQPRPSRAVYMRDYRQRRKIDTAIAAGRISNPSELVDLRGEQDRLIQEVAHLKRQLAVRGRPRANGQLTSYPAVVADDATVRRARQAVIDAALAKVNRTGRQ